MEISTPAILFSTISLLLLAFTNRYLAMANLIRGLHQKYQKEGNSDSRLVPQVKKLLLRLRLIRNMQILAVVSLLFSAISTLLIFLNYSLAAQWLFGTAMVTLIMALLLSVWEISLSNEAIKIELSDMEDVLK